VFAFIFIKVYQRQTVFVLGPFIANIHADIEIFRKLPFEIAAYFFIGIALPNHIDLLIYRFQWCSTQCLWCQVSGVSVQVSAFRSLASRFWLLANNQ
jgi:hypothetical protein